MTYTIAQPCVDLKDKACIEECPVDCIYEGGRMLYIHPDECVDCGACEPVCPVEAIFYEDDVPAEWTEYTKANADFFVDLFTTALEAGELLASVSVPGYGKGTGAAYLKHRHPASSYAVVGLAALVMVFIERTRWFAVGLFIALAAGLVIDGGTCIALLANQSR